MILAGGNRSLFVRDGLGVDFAVKVARKNLLDGTIETLRAEIIACRLPPGSRLTEIGLAAEMAMGRSTVRSALLQLEKEDLVRRARYSAWSVADLTPEVIWEVYTLRGALEGLAARILAARLDADSRAELLSAYAALETAEAGGGTDARVTADLAFHRAVVTLSGHQRLAREYGVLAHKIEWIYRWSEGQAPGRIVLPDWHKPVLDSILAGDPDAAERSIRSLTASSLGDDLADLASNRQKTA